MWRVAIAPHRIAGGRWRLPASTVDIPAATASDASARAIAWAQSDAGVPAWRPCRRESVRYTRAERLEAPADQQTFLELAA